MKKSSFSSEKPLQNAKNIDIYKEYKYTKQDQSILKNLFNFLYQNLMNIFSKTVHFLEKQCSKLETKYSRENLGYFLCILSNILSLFPALHMKTHQNIDVYFTLLVRGFTTVIFASIIADIKDKKLIDFCKEDKKILTIRALAGSIAYLFY